MLPGSGVGRDRAWGWARHFWIFQSQVIPQQKHNMGSYLWALNVGGHRAGGRLLPGTGVCISGVKEPSQSDHSQDSLAVTLPPPVTLTAGAEAPLQQQLQ